MKIMFGNKKFALGELEEEKYIESYFTGNKLHCFYKSISVGEENNEHFKEILKKCEAGGIFELDENDDHVNEYKVRNDSSYSINSNYMYSLYFEQVEKLEVTKLQVGSLLLDPYNYFEEYDDGIVIEARVNLTNSEWDTIIEMANAKSLYFKVIRHGINEQEINMRFGMNIWSENDNKIKARIILVQDKKDTVSSFKGFNQPESSNVKNKLINLECCYNELLELLSRKNVINDEEKNNIKINVKEKFNKKYEELYKVKDVDEFLDK